MVPFSTNMMVFGNGMNFKPRKDMSNGESPFQLRTNMFLKDSGFSGNVIAPGFNGLAKTNPQNFRGFI